MTRRNWDLWALGGVLLVGAGMRFVLMLRWRPGFLGYPDSSAYLAGVRQPFADNMRPQGYPSMLDLVGVVSPNLSFATLVQHGLGLTTAVLAFALVRLIGVPRWAGLIPAAVVALGGAQIFVEHAILAESWFNFFVVLALTLAAAASWRSESRAWQPWVLAGMAGLVLGLSTTLRALGLFLVPSVLVYLAMMVQGSWRTRAAHAAVAAGCCAVVVLGFMAMHERSTGKFALTENQFYNYYGRVSGFADCAEFDEPMGHDYLCPKIPPSQREGHDWWLFNEESPFRQELGQAYGVSPTEDQARAIKGFAVSAVLAQPVDYLNAVLRDFVRVVDPSFQRNGNEEIGNKGAGLGPDDLVANYKNKDWTTISLYQHVGFTADQYGVYKGFGALETYERWTRFTGVRMFLLLLLALAGATLAMGRRQRAGALLAMSSGLTLLIVPILIAKYDFRFTIPAYAPLAVSAAVAIAGIAERFADRKVSSSARPAESIPST